MKSWAVGLMLLSAVSSAGDSVPAARREWIMNLLRQDCGSCHGMLLKGGLGPALLPDVLINKPDQMLIDTILNGRPGTAMPPWREFLSPAEAAWLVTRLRQPAASP